MQSSTWVFLSRDKNAKDALGGAVFIQLSNGNIVRDQDRPIDFKAFLFYNQAALSAHRIILVDMRPDDIDLTLLTDQHFMDFIRLALTDRTIAVPLDAITMFTSIIKPDTHIVSLGSLGEAKARVAAIADAEAGKLIIFNHQEQLNLGASEWDGGHVFRNGTPVARYSYNGRLWPLSPWTSEMESLTELPVVAE